VERIRTRNVDETARLRIKRKEQNMQSKFLATAALAAGLAGWSTAPTAATAADVGFANSPQPGIEFIRDHMRHGDWNGGGNWGDGDRWRYRHHHRHHDGNFFPGVGFSFGFAPGYDDPYYPPQVYAPYYPPQQNCYRDRWGRLWCNAY
jgi:hypothetical protein